MEIIKKRYVKKINDQVQVIIYDKIEKEWVSYFLQFHSKLVNTYPQLIKIAQIKDTFPEWLQY